MSAKEFAERQAREWLSDTRLLKFARRQINQDLRRWRQSKQDGNPDADYLIADCKAKLRLLSWIESWSRVREPGYSSDPSIRAEMQAEYVLVISSLRFLAQAWKDREGWRSEWERP